MVAPEDYGPNCQRLGRVSMFPQSLGVLDSFPYRFYKQPVSNTRVARLSLSVLLSICSRLQISDIWCFISSPRPHLLIPFTSAAKIPFHFQRQRQYPAHRNSYMIFRLNIFALFLLDGRLYSIQRLQSQKGQRQIISNIR